MADTQATSTGNVNPGRSNQHEARAWKPLLVFVCFTIAINMAGYAVFERYKKNIKGDKQNELAAIAELKVDQITHWMTERKGDAQVVKDDSLFVSAVDRWLQRGGPAGETKTQLIEHLASLQHAYMVYGYTSISLFDDHAMLRLSSSAEEAPIEGIEKERLLESMRTGQIAFSEIQWEKHGTAEVFEIDLVAPLFIGKGKQARVIGAVLFHIDPSLFLFPLIQRWPTPSPSAENLLVRRDGNEVVFLNELRHRKNTPLAMRFPLDQQQSPATKAVMGQEGLADGVDYRGVSVVGVLNAVPGTSWFMVSKIDQAEIYASINQLANGMMVLMLTFFGLSGGITVFLRQKEKKQHKSKLERQVLAMHLDYLVKYANDIILLHDSTGKIINFNDRALEVYGYTAAEFSGMNMAFLRAIEFTPPFAEKLEKIDLAGALRFESTHVRKNRAFFPVDASVCRIDIGGEKIYQAIICDITERKTSEEMLHFHSDILKSLMEGVFLIRASDGVIVFTNPQFERMFGYESGELLYKHVSRINAPNENSPEATANAINDELAREGVWRGEVHNIRKDGTTFWCHVSASTFEYPQYGKVWVSVHKDITESKQALDLLRKSSEDIEDLYNNAACGYHSLDKNGIISQINNTELAWLGYTREDVIGKINWKDLLTPMGIQTFRETFPRLMKQGFIRDIETEIVRKDGTVLVGLINATAIYDPSGNYIMSRSTIIDITERKRIEKALKTSEAKFRSIIEATPVPMALYDKQLNITFLNQAFEKTFGYSIDDIPTLAEWRPRAYPDPDYRRWVETTWQTTLETAKREHTDFPPLEFVIHCKNNSIKTVLMSAATNHYEYEGMHLVMLFDITQRKQMEVKLDSIFNASVEGIITIDLSDNIVSANTAVETIFGYKPEELVGCSINKLMPPTPREMNFSLPHTVKYIGQIRETEGIHKNGSAVPLDLSTAEFTIDNTHYFTKIVRDVSLRKHREQQDKKHLDELAHVTRLGLMSEMASGIAHELNQPLTAISSYSQVSLNFMNAESPDLIKITEILNKTQQQALRAGQIIHRMRNFIKSDSKHRSTTDINTLIHNAASLCIAEIKQNSIKLTFELENNLPPIYVDHIQIEQVLINLIRNSADALRYLPEKQQRQLIIYSQLTTNNGIQVRVKDNGVGLNQDQQQKILTPFYTTKVEGMGMGLSISRSLIEAHEGTFDFNSELGKGTTFYFTLPIEKI